MAFLKRNSETAMVETAHLFNNHRDVSLKRNSETRMMITGQVLPVIIAVPFQKHPYRGEVKRGASMRLRFDTS